MAYSRRTPARRATRAPARTRRPVSTARRAPARRAAPRARARPQQMKLVIETRQASAVSRPDLAGMTLIESPRKGRAKL